MSLLHLMEIYVEYLQACMLNSNPLLFLMETAVAERDFFPTDFMYIVRSGTSSFCFEWFSNDESLSIYFQMILCIEKNLYTS